MKKAKKRFKFNKKLPHPSDARIVILVGSLMLMILAAFPTNIFSIEVEEEIAVPYSSVHENNDQLELGEENVVVAGINGEEKEVYKHKRSFYDLIFGSKGKQGELLRTVSVKKPVDEVREKGTLRWQYMMCVDGSYRYYTDEQMKDPTMGFTSKSEDSCKTENNSEKLRLARSLNETPVNKVPSIPANAPKNANCKTITIPYNTIEKMDSSMGQGQTWVSGGYEGYKYVCDNGYVGFNIPPISAVKHIGTKPPITYVAPDINIKQPDSAAKAVCESNYKSALSQMQAKNVTGDSGAMYQLNALHRLCLSQAGY